MLSILLLVFQYQPVQTWAAKKVTHYLSEKLGTKVDIKSIYIKPFTSIVLEDFYVLDKQNDTLIRTPKLTVELNGFSVFSSIPDRKIDLKLIQLDNGSFYLKNLAGNKTNFKFIIDSLASKDTSKTTPVTKSKPWTLIFQKIAVNNFHFRYKNTLKKDVVKGVNFDDVDVRNFSTVVNNMDIYNHLFKAQVRNLTLKEKSGFNIKNFTANATVDSNQILVEKLLLKTPNSNIKDYLRMRFKTFDDMKDFENKVRMEGRFKSSHISSKDIAYFADLEKMKFELGLNGHIQGKMNDLRAKDLVVTTGQATFVKGDFSVKGLPDFDKTFMELDFDQVATNKKDLDRVIAGFTGNTKTKAPDILSKFGNISFKGRFTGLQNNFVAYGSFKTKLGRFDPDINLKIDKNGHPSYSGKINAYDFDLGTLLDEADLGRATFNANVQGSGDKLETLNEKVIAKIAHIYFKGYNYHNVAVNGNFINQKVSGKLTINDVNVKLDADGSVNLKSDLPEYDFSALITDAHLNKLKLLKDTITISTQIKTKITGNSLKNLQGEALFSPIRIVDPRNNYLLDSIYIAAVGAGDVRSINFRSDALDGSIKGSYDLATLPSYFKTIVKKYIPSLKTTIVEPKPQNFEFNLSIKNLDPLTAIFLPELKIPERGTFIGRFNSEDKTATLNGFIKTIKYGDMVFHDFILDESTLDQFMSLNISMSRVDLTEKLYLKDVDVTNFLNNDSLKFNIKLADKNATNQLDLYGRVAFGRDTLAKLEILPSDVILENQKWHVEEAVRVRFLEGKAQVSGFELSNGLQKVKVDGLISPSINDKLNVVFEQFNMGTFNQLTRTSDIELHGLLNGNVELSSILKSPGIDAKLKIDSLKMNTTQIGDVSIVSNLDNEKQRAAVKMGITSNGLKTLDIDGTYFIKNNEDDGLDFNITMDKTKAIIFEPFIKDLVSNIKGTLSTDLKLTGTPKRPQLNGDVEFNDMGVTVNYLKTPFILNDKVTVKNSIINIEKLTLRDTIGGKGVATGSVNLADPGNPIIDVKLTVENGNALMALNTTFKDNHVYFGKAFATGDFSFKGPVDNMSIDIDATTQAGTVFNLPLNASSTVSDYDFIKFVSHKDTTNVEVDKKKNFNGVTLNFLLDVDEKSTVIITTDYGVLQGSGTARRLSLKINSLGDFEMFGDFNITSGKFEFTAKNFISKNFVVNQGGNIRWTGNPANAEINLNAVYEVRTPVSPLYTAAGLQSPRGNQQVLVQANLLITKSLLKPNIDFDFNFPTDPQIKEDVSTYLADNNNRSQQALSIIVRRVFAPGTGSNLGNQVFNTAYSAISEFAFNKLNSLISQSNIKGFDLNIKSPSDASASLKFMNERLIFNGSLFNNSGNNSIFNSNNSLLNSDFNKLTKDFEALYRIRPDGNLTARYSYRVLNTNTINTADQLNVQYVNGLGLVYQKDFDNFGDFFKNIFRNSNRRNRRLIPLDQSVPLVPTPGTLPKADTPGGPANKDEED
ncbi:hypothetical protein ACVW2L_002990 [Mucilaginibacter sp. HD30]